MKSSRWIFALLWLAGLVFGGIGVVERFLDGHRLAAYTSYVPWGIWVAAYIYFVGLSVGAFLLASVIYAFGLKRFEQVGRVALVTALVTLVMALLSIWFDLGHLERFFYVFTRPNFRSVMAWMIWMYTAYAVFLAFMAYRSLWGGAGMRLLGMIGIPVAVAVPRGRRRALRDTDRPRVLAQLSVSGAVCDRRRGLGPGPGAGPGCVLWPAAGRHMERVHQRGRPRYPGAAAV